MPAKRPWFLDPRLCCTVLLAFCCLCLVPADGGAALIGSRLADGDSVSQRTAQVETIRQALEREIVVQRLADFGLSAAEVSARLPSFSDEQLHQLAALSDGLGEGGVLGAVIAVLLIVLLVVVIVKVMDKEIVVK